MNNTRAKKVVSLAAASTIAAVSVALLVTSATALIFFRKIDNNLASQRRSLKVEEGILSKTSKNQPFNILVLGVDKRKNDRLFRADSIILVRVHPQKKSIWSVSIPRDIVVGVPGAGQLKLSESYSWGKEEEVIRQVQKLSGQKINHIVVLDFNDFKKIIDALGGIEVNVPSKIVDRRADYSKEKKASILFEGKQVLDGAHALTLARTRNYSDGDFSRMRNQQRVVNATFERAKILRLSEIPKFCEEISKFLKTDMTAKDIIQTSLLVKSVSSKNVYKSTLDGEWEAPFVKLNTKKAEDIFSRLSNDVPFD